MALSLSTLLYSLNFQTVLVGVIVILIIYKTIQRYKYNLPPGPFAFPIIGNYEVIKAEFIHSKLDDYRRKYGPVFKIYLGPAMVVVLNDIKVVTEALIKQKADFANRPQNAATGLLTQGGKDIAFANYTPRWKLHRRIAGKALRQYMSGNHLEEVVHASMSSALDQMAKETTTFNPESYIDQIIFHISNKVVFGENVDPEDLEYQHFMKLKTEVSISVGSFFIEDILPFLVNVRPSAKYRRLKEMIEELLELFKRKLEHHEKTFDHENIRDLTDALILARREAEKEENIELLSQLTDDHVLQTMGDIFFAGIDTTRLTIYFALRYMAGLPDIQSKVQQELDDVVGSWNEKMPCLKDRENLGYGEATLHEIMRLGTVVPLGIPHMTLCDTKVGGFDVPQNTMVFINHWALHHDDNYWKDVHTFDPTRFLDSNGKLGNKPESWLPFSAGRRVCLGETVAKPEIHLIFSTILQRFEISLPDVTNPEVELIASPVGVQPAPYKIIIKERQ